MWVNYCLYPMSAQLQPPHVAKVECGGGQDPLERHSIDCRDVLEAKIIVFGLTMGLLSLIREPIHDVNAELVQGRVAKY
jgi:hypothetical protein